jgi:hypothetical protein
MRKSLFCVCLVGIMANLQASQYRVQDLNVRQIIQQGPQNAEDAKQIELAQQRTDARIARQVAVKTRSDGTMLLKSYSETLSLDQIPDAIQRLSAGADAIEKTITERLSGAQPVLKALVKQLRSRASELQALIK